MSRVLLVQFGELSLKGKNRHLFETRLISNIKTTLHAESVVIEKQYGRLYIQPANGDEFENEEFVLSQTSRVFGIATILLGHRINGDYADIEKMVLSQIHAEDFESFAVRTHRSDKRFPMTSEEVNRKLGAAVVEAYNKKVHLKTPDTEIHVIIMDTGIVVALNKIRGAGGLPVGSSGKMISLLSS